LRDNQKTENTTMTEDRMALLELAETHACGDLLREFGQKQNETQLLEEAKVELQCSLKVAS